MNITNDYIIFTNYTDNEDDNTIILIKSLLLSYPSNFLLLRLISLIVRTIL